MQSFRQATNVRGINGSPISVRQVARNFMLSSPISLKRVIQNLQSSEIKTNEVYSDLGSNHKMWTTARLNTATGLLEANTRTATFTWFGGYRGGVQVVLLDTSEFIIYKTQARKFGVDGTLIGQNDRTETWSESIPMDIVARTSSLQVFHFWADDTVANLNRALSVGTAIADAIAGVFALFGSRSGTGK